MKRWRWSVCVFVWNAHMRTANILCLMWIQNRIIIYLIHRNCIVCLCPIPFHWAFDSDCCRHKRMKKWFFCRIRLGFSSASPVASTRCSFHSTKIARWWVHIVVCGRDYGGLSGYWMQRNMKQHMPHVESSQITILPTHTKTETQKWSEKRPYMSCDLIHDDFVFSRRKYYISMDLFPY